MSAGPVEEFAPAKINLALHVLGRRGDGYHDLDSIVAFASIGDRLRLARSEAFALEIEGPFAPSVPQGSANIVFKAFGALAAHLAAKRIALAPVHMRLQKNLPMAAGIGGGSADAAAALRGLVKLQAVPVSDAELAAVAGSIGADVPVCLASRLCRMRGTGDRIDPLPGAAPRAAVLVNPRKACETAAVFAALGLAAGARHGGPIGDFADPASWRNDLTEAAVRLVPETGDVLAALAAMPGIVVARMSGSGATCFGLFGTMSEAETAAHVLAQRGGWWSVPVTLA